MKDRRSPSTPHAAGGPERGLSLRVLGVLILVMFVLTSVIGGALAGGSSYSTLDLGSHIVLALVTISLCSYGSAVVSRAYGTYPRLFVRLAGLSAGVATLAGAVFLLFGESDVALYAMSGFALVGMVASVLVIALGAAPGSRAVTTEQA